MFGHRWVQGEATIVVSHTKKTSGDGMVSIREYVADVRPPGVAAFRATIQEPTIATDFWPPSAGDVVSVLIQAKSGKVDGGKVKFDKDDPRISHKARTAAAAAAFAAAAGAPVATGQPIAGLGISIDAIRAAARKAMVDGNVIFAGGSGQADVVDGAQPADPADRLAKLEALKERGLLSDDEYAAARTRIIDAI